MKKSGWKEMFERADAENSELHQEIVKYKLRELIISAVNQCDDNDRLECMAIFCGKLVNMKFTNQGANSYYEKTAEDKR